MFTDIKPNSMGFIADVFLLCMVYVACSATTAVRWFVRIINEPSFVLRFRRTVVVLNNTSASQITISGTRRQCGGPIVICCIDMHKARHCTSIVDIVNVVQWSSCSATEAQQLWSSLPPSTPRVTLTQDLELFGAHCQRQ
jgi:hypothetical protein